MMYHLSMEGHAERDRISTSLELKGSIANSWYQSLSGHKSVKQETPLCICCHNSACPGPIPALQVNQTPSLLLTLMRLLSAEGVVRLPKRASSKPIDACWSCLRWCHAILLLLCSVTTLHLRATSKLLAKEWIVPSLGCMQFVEALPGAVDESTWRRVLGWNSHLAGITKRIHTFARR